MGDDWIAARYLLSSILGRNPLVLDHVDEESFPVDASNPRAGGGGGRGGPVAVPAVRAPESVAGTVCAVCTEEIAAGDAAARLPCAHWYHAGCIAPWLGIRGTCPSCRAEVPPSLAGGEEEGGGGGVGEKPRAGGAAGVSGLRRERGASPHEQEYLPGADGGVVSG
ncbi:E3 ubiquitin-protein ligase CIP8 [Brachypodium distachyon]|uniref:RING-type domain-containing protein n=1 Tax=Brachypodium distachyon TaxID=15368 RepID=I1IM44_BRADI|nr:E3 ubiquitin-protein ligase CIP8 [Brachypodium distachyon]KQJ88720.1 hypothetical protein BRADI_4g20690v3 [Brachypodium distachyon]|eukprot:XP_003577630.1 E3 ubiquitin-protein ligase CIP8 [Brachypodium distachyon]